MTWTVDASVVVKWFIDEDSSAEARALIGQALIGPDVLILECLAVLAREVRRGKMLVPDAQAAAVALQRSGIALEPTLPLADDIMALSLRLSYPVYDCAYAAVARKAGGVLITADRKFAARCSRPDALDLGLRVRCLGDGPPTVQERPPRPYLPRRRAA